MPETTITAGETLKDWNVTKNLSTPLKRGDTITFTKQFTREDVLNFAHTTGDTNPLHLDKQTGNESIFSENIVHGMLSASVISAAIARLPGTAVYISQTLNFHNPVYMNDRVTATVEIQDTLDENKYSLKTTVSTDDEEVVIDGTAQILLT